MARIYVFTIHQVGKTQAPIVVSFKNPPSADDISSAIVDYGFKGAQTLVSELDGLPEPAELDDLFDYAIEQQGDIKWPSIGMASDDGKMMMALARVPMRIGAAELDPDLNGWRND